MRRTAASAIASILAGVLFSGFSGAADAPKSGADSWPRWRGPTGDGISPETGWDPAALSGSPRILWKVNVGKGNSAVAVAGGHLYTMGTTGKEDVVQCLKAEDGKEVWRFPYACPEGDYHGPRATPVLDDTSLFTISREGVVHCLDAAKGRPKWIRNLAKEMKARAPKWGFASSAKVHGSAVLFNACTFGVALDKKSGRTLWASPAGIGGYSTPVVFNVGNKPAVAIFGEKAFHLVDLASGRSFGSHEWITEYDVNAADPAVSGTTVFITSGYGKGCAALSVAGGKIAELWRNASIASHFSSVVIIDEHVYGVHGNTQARDGAVKCLELKTGAEKWAHTTGYGSLIASDGKLIFYGDKGDLVVLQADPAGAKELGRSRPLELSRGAICWTAPVLCGGRLYLRTSAGDLASLEVKK